MLETYPQYRRPCGWQALLAPRDARPALTGDVDCELAVIGAGYTGLAAARVWAEVRPDDRVVVLEAAAVGDGSPGRNSGFMLEIALADDADPSAIERMTRCNALIGEAMAALRDLVRRHDIRCELERAGTYRGAATRRGQRYLERYRAFLDAAGLEYRVLGAGELAARLGTGYYRYGLYSPDCSLVQPAALVRGLADHRPPSVVLHEHTPVLGVEPHGRAWRLECPGGAVRARQVILANNAFARRLGPAVRRLAPRLAAIYTYAALTRPLEEGALAALGSEPSWGLLPAHRLGTTLRRTRDGRMLVRCFYGYEREEDNDRVAGRLRACLVRRYPQLVRRDDPFEHVWGGATGFTYNGSPVWGELAPGLWASLGCNGGGVVKGTLFGTLLAKQALGETVPDITALFGAASRMPPEPVRRIGFLARSSFERRAAGLET